MKARILEGKPIASRLQKRLRQQIKNLTQKYQASPKLVAVSIGEDIGVKSYINSQKKLAKNLGIQYELCKLDKDISSDSLIKKIKELNSNDDVTAILLLMPLPDKLDTKNIISEISWKKDVEGIHSQNLGRLVFRSSELFSEEFNFAIPCTPQAVMELLSSADLKTIEDFKGKEAVIIGDSEIVGKPLALLLLNRLSTVTICHIWTKDIKQHIKRADILISAAGKPNLVKGEWIKNQAVVIDVGTSKLGKKIVGDVEFNQAKEKACCISPVPGGVGPLTVTILMKNVIRLFKLQKENIIK